MNSWWNILSSLCCIFTRMPLLQAIKLPCWILCSVFFTNYGCSQSNMCAIKPCSVKQYSFSRERNSVENHALYDHSFKNLTVQSHKDCFENCAWDCRCKSFNFVTRMKQKNCHLNEQDRYVEPGALKRTIGFSYHEIGIEYNIKVWYTHFCFDFARMKANAIKEFSFPVGDEVAHITVKGVSF